MISIGGLAAFENIGAYARRRARPRYAAPTQRTWAQARVSAADVKTMIIAYEPVWAIGTGLVIILGCVSVLVFVVRYRCISISIHPFILPYILTCMHECIFAHIDC